MTVALSSKMSGKTHDEEDVDVGTPGAPGVLVGYVGDALAAARSELDYCHGQEVRVPRETAISGQPVECWIGGGHAGDGAGESSASWGVTMLHDEDLQLLERADGGLVGEAGVAPWRVGGSQGVAEKGGDEGAGEVGKTGPKTRLRSARAASESFQSQVLTPTRQAGGRPAQTPAPRATMGKSAKGREEGHQGEVAGGGSTVKESRPAGAPAGRDGGGWGRPQAVRWCSLARLRFDRNDDG